MIIRHGGCTWLTCAVRSRVAYQKHFLFLNWSAHALLKRQQQNSIFRERVVQMKFFFFIHVVRLREVY